MQFSFMVGITEPHRVDFSFDQFGGHLEIKVDGLPVVDEVRMFSVSLTKLMLVTSRFERRRTWRGRRFARTSDARATGVERFEELGEASSKKPASVFSTVKAIYPKKCRPK